MTWNLKRNAVGFVRIGLMAMLFGAAYSMWQVFLVGVGHADIPTVIFRFGLLFVAFGAATKFGLLCDAKPSDAQHSAAAGAPQAARV